jgi:hypothetical protein
MRPQTGECSFGRQAHSQLLVKRDGQTLDQNLSVPIFGDGHIAGLLFGSNQPQDMAILLKSFDNFAEGVGDTVDIRRIGFRHHRNVHVRSMGANPLYLNMSIVVHGMTMNGNCNSFMTI